VVSLLLAFRGLARAVAAVWRDPETKALPFVAGALVLTGTIFYWRAEDWTIIQALYFSIVTLTTVGYGDLTRQAPEHRSSPRAAPHESVCAPADTAAGPTEPLERRQAPGRFARLKSWRFLGSSVSQSSVWTANAIANPTWPTSRPLWPPHPSRA
jgi:hypothetical protein